MPGKKEKLDEMDGYLKIGGVNIFLKLGEFIILPFFSAPYPLVQP